MEDRMTSKLVVNTIEADTGISSVSFASSISLSSTSKFFFSDAGINIGPDTNINRPATGVLGFNINSSEKLRIASTGKVGLGTDAPQKILHALSSENSVARLQTTAAIGRLEFKASGTTTHPYIEWNDNDLMLETSGNQRLAIKSGGVVLVGSGTVSRNVAARDAKLQIQGITGNDSALSITRNSDNVNGPHIDFAKSRADSLTDNTVVQAGDILGRITFCGADGTDTISMAAEIKAEVDGTPGSNDMPGRLVFKTTADGAAGTTERLRINSAGVSTFYNDVTIDTTALATSADLTIKAGEGGSAYLYMIADDGDDGGDNWRISAMAGFSNRLIFYNSASGSYTDVVSFQTDGTIRPGTNNSANLGTSSYRWANVYTNDLHLSNQGSTNSIDNTWGDYTIQEGESDLFLINNRNGKKYKFNLTEVT